MRPWKTLALLVAAALVVLIAVTRGLGGASDPDPAVAPAPGVSQTPTKSAAASPGAAEPEQHSHDHELPSSELDDARALWQPVVVGFGRQFTNLVGGAAGWRTRLGPYSTVAVQQQLAGVDIAKVPAGRYDSFEVLEHSDDQLAAKVTYREGWALVLYVISEGDRWKVYRYDRFEE